MNRLTINGSSYALPFEKLFRPHTEIESRELAESIRDIGVQVPIITYISPTHGRAVIDGIGRGRKAIEVGSDRKVPVEDYGEISDADAESIARHLNKRRHLTPEELKELREQERKRIPELRKAGLSLRAIGKEVKEDVATVHRILKQSPVEDSTPDDDLPIADEYPPLPGRVRGSDGKSYPARRPEPSDDEILKGMQLPNPKAIIFGKLTHLFEDVRRELAALKELGKPLRKKERDLLISHRNEITAVLKASRAGSKA